MDFLLSLVYTLVVTLLPYVITFLITRKKKITIKTTDILTVIFSIVSFVIFCIIGFLSGQSGISVAPVVIWNIIGYLIIRTNTKIRSEKEQIESEKTDIISNAEKDINSTNTHIVKVKIKKSEKAEKESKEIHKSKNKSKIAIIVLSVLTAIFATSTIILTICLANTTTEINEANSKISELNKQNEELIKEKKELQDDSIERLEQRLFGEPTTTSRLEELRKNKGKYELVTDADSEEEAGKKYWAEHYTKP